MHVRRVQTDTWVPYTITHHSHRDNRQRCSVLLAGFRGDLEVRPLELAAHTQDAAQRLHCAAIAEVDGRSAHDAARATPGASPGVG